MPAYLANEGIELSEDLGEPETMLREQLLKIGARALDLHLSRQRPGYEGSSRACAYGKRQRFLEDRPKIIATLLGTVTIKQGYYRCGHCDASCLPYDQGVGLGRGHRYRAQFDPTAQR